jgi:hypothetical protein
MRHFLRHTMTFRRAHTYGRRRLWHTHCAAFFIVSYTKLGAHHLPVNYCEVNTACSIGIEHRECCSTVSEPEPAHLLVMCTLRAPPILSRRPFALLRLARAHRLSSQSLSTSLIPADARVCKAATAHETLSTPIPPGCSPPLPPRCMGSRQARSSQITCTLYVRTQMQPLISLISYPRVSRFVNINRLIDCRCLLFNKDIYKIASLY